MRTAFFMISGETDGESREIGEDVFDGLVRDRAAWDLFAAMKGDLVWACGGPLDEAERESRRGERMYAANVIPLIQLARTRRWLTPSQVAELRAPSEVPEPAADMEGEDRYRKALEKGRRAVDVCVEKRGKLGIWRAIETGPKAANGERRYRFKQRPTHDDGAPVSYCLLWAEDVADGLVFEPAGDSAASLPLCDGGWGLRQFRVSGLKLTVRDVVWAGPHDELVVLADLRNESAAPMSLTAMRLYMADGVTAPESTAVGPRIRARHADVIRALATPRANRRASMLDPGGTVHFVCWAWNLRSMLDQLDGRTLSEVRVEVQLGDGGRASVVLPFRVSGSPVAGHLHREGGGWRLAEGFREAVYEAGAGRILAALERRRGRR